MFQLNNLSPLVKKRKRVGRGGSRGGTSGAGHKGQKARSGGYVRIGFEGGQMPLFRRLPKRGFNNTRFQTEVVTLSLQRLNDLFDAGTEVNREALIERGIVSRRENSVVKILAVGKLEKKLTVCVDAFSKAAVQAIESCGGEARVTKGI